MTNDFDMTDAERAAWLKRRAEYEDILTRLEAVGSAYNEGYWALSSVPTKLLTHGIDELTHGPLGPMPFKVESVFEAVRGCREELRRAAAEVDDAVRMLKERAEEEVGVSYWGSPHLTRRDDGDSAIDTILGAQDSAATGHDSSFHAEPAKWRDAVFEAGLVLQMEVRRLRIELERAVTERMKSGGPEPAPLRDGRDSGGRRQFLMGRPVSAGTHLMLQSRWGWMPGRVETGAEGQPIFYLRPFPGTDQQVVWEITSEMRFAWPSDLERAAAG